METFRLATLGGTLCASLLLLSINRAAAGELVTTPSLTAPASASANSDSTAPVLSADGNFAIFSSQASNLTTNDNNGPLLDVFLRNLTNRATLLLSVTPDGIASGNGTSIGVAISSNNQFVVFESCASNLVTNDTNNASDIFLRDVVNGKTTLVSVNRFGSGAGNDSSSNP